MPSFLINLVWYNITLVVLQSLLVNYHMPSYGSHYENTKVIQMAGSFEESS
jgi:hypothetical protein